MKKLLPVDNEVTAKLVEDISAILMAFTNEKYPDMKALTTAIKILKLVDSHLKSKE